MQTTAPGCLTPEAVIPARLPLGAGRGRMSEIAAGAANREPMDTAWTSPKTPASSRPLAASASTEARFWPKSKARVDMLPRAAFVEALYGAGS